MKAEMKVDNVQLPEGYYIFQDELGIYLFTDHEFVAAFNHYVSPYAIKSVAKQHLHGRDKE